VSPRPTDQRLFVAVWPTAAVLGRIEEIQAQLPPKGRHVRPANVHLTLAFLGDVTSARLAECERALGGVEASAFELVLDRIGVWRRSRIVWLGTSAEAPAVQHLAGQVSSRLAGVGFPREVRPFRTHVTLARKLDRLPRPPEFRPVEWPVQRFALTASELSPAGARYRNVREWSLY
jgi:2'-5' RNA ligase